MCMSIANHIFTQNGGQKQLILSPKFISDENG